MEENIILLYDSDIVSYNVDILEKIINLKIKPHFNKTGLEFAIISFTGVVSHEFFNVNLHNSIHFLDKHDPKDYVDNNFEYFEEKDGESFFPINNYSIGELKTYFMENKIFIYEIGSINGLKGLIFAKEMKIFNENGEVEDGCINDFVKF